MPAMPPPVSIAIENILPRPLTRKILTRCLNQNSEVVTLFAIRILTVAFRKLSAVLKVFDSDHGLSQTLWDQTSSKLATEFCHRCPSIKDVILLFRRTPKENLQQQNVITELIAQFYEAVPSIAFEASFDVSLILIDVLKRLEESDLSREDSETLLSQLHNLLKITEQSASMRWWQQPGKHELTFPNQSHLFLIMLQRDYSTLLSPRS
jgi:nucleolar pre-ribosomal-associated protein 1